MNRIIKILFVIIFVSCAFISNSFAEYETAEDLISEGLKVYVEKGSKAAIEAWIKGSTLEGSKEALTQANMFSQIEDYYGSYEDYDIIQSKDISKRSKSISLSMNYAGGPVYAVFILYKKSSGKWVTALFRFHTDPLEVIPPEMVFKDDI